MVVGDINDRDEHRIAGVARMWWTVVGAFVGLGIAGLLTIGLIFLALALVMTLAGVRVTTLRNRSTFMVLVGAAIGPLLVAWFNRSGPGSACQVDGAVTSCSQQMNPWPFVATAIVLIAAGAAFSRGVLRSPERVSTDGSGVGGGHSAQ